MIEMQQPSLASATSRFSVTSTTGGPVATRMDSRITEMRLKRSKNPDRVDQSSSALDAQLEALGVAFCAARLRLEVCERENGVLRAELRRLIPLAEELGSSAMALPRAVAFAGGLAAEANELRAHADQAEREASMLATVLLRDDLDEMERGDNPHDEKD